jgi:hypothetical protein
MVREERPAALDVLECEGSVAGRADSAETAQRTKERTYFRPPAFHERYSSVSPRFRGYFEEIPGCARGARQRRSATRTSLHP